jgi:hypothetical protein
MKSASLPFVAIVAAVIPACQTGPVTDSTINEGPVFGKKDETNIVVATDGGEVSLDNLAKIVKTVRKYKRLNASEQEIIRRVAALKLDGVVAMEMQRLAPKFEPRKQAVRRRTTEQVAEVRRQGARRKINPAQIAQEVTTVESTAAAELAAIDAEWRQAATQAVTQRYGSDFAVPVRTADNRSVVAFASVRQSGVQVASDAYELNFTAAQFAIAKRAGLTVPHGGADFAVLDTEAVIDQ